MNIFVNTFLLVYAGLFPIVNPFGSAPLFLGFTEAYDEKLRNTLALQIAINSFFLLLGSMLIGSHVLEFFGIGVPTVRIAGGLVVTAFGWKLLNTATVSDGNQAAHQVVEEEPDSFYPLTMPLTVGPGSISVAITIGSQRPASSDVEQFVLVAAAAAASILAIALTIYFCYRFAQRLVSSLGHGGTHVVVRLSAFILLCIGIQILWGGLSELLHLA